MSVYRQYYDGSGVPLRIDEDLAAPAEAWRSQRARMGQWLDALPEDAWSGPTRCEDWDVTLLVRHLASGCQFLGYTLHKAAAGTATTLLTGFDTHVTVNAAAAMLGDLTPAQAREAMAAADASVEREFSALGPDGWMAAAEAPPGRVPAYLAVSHFLFDSWVHEYDLMVPRGEQPVLVADEVVPVASYVLGLAVVTADSGQSLDVRLTDLDLRIGVDAVDGGVSVTPGTASAGAAVIEGRSVDVIDLATGRPSGPVSGDAAGLAVLAGLAALLAS